MEWLMNGAKQLLASVGMKILMALAVLFIGFFLTGWVSKLLKRVRLLERVDKSVGSYVRNTIVVALRILVVVTALMILGIPATSFVTVLASAGVTIGLALQGSLSNLAGGIMLMFFRPYSVGDTVRAMNMEGTVKEISAFYTTLVTKDNSRVILPNGALNNSCIVNYSAEKTRRIQFSLSLPEEAGESVQRAEILSVLSERGDVLREPQAQAVVSGHSANQMEFTVTCWCEAQKYDDIMLVIRDETLRALQARHPAAA